MIVILGGGLAGSLLAYRLALLDHPPDFLLIEAQDQLSPNKTWSFHETDLQSTHLKWLRPLVFQTWDKQEVKFKGYQRVFENPYHSINSSHFSKIVQQKLGNRLLLNEKVLSVTPNEIVLESGRRLKSQLTFDARGFESKPHSINGYQKFVGIDLKLSKPHGLKHPIIMDSRCEQKEGYRFFYLLPWSSDSLLIEDTRYSTESTLNLRDFQAEIRNYCLKSGWNITEEARTEVGVLPIPLENLSNHFDSSQPIRIGMRGGYFHLTTGYSVPMAVEVADTIARECETNPEACASDILNRLRPIQTKVRKQARFFSLLNKMLFLAATPSKRWKIFDRFYRLPEGLIFRFYQGDMKFTDQARVLIGRPPVPIFSALSCILNFKTYKLQQGLLNREKPSSEQ